MSLKLRLIILEFLQFFIWGSWLISLGGYLSYGLEVPANGSQIGAIFATSGFAALITPGIMGIIADKWVNSERLLSICHIIGAIVLYFASRASSYEELFPLMLLNALVFMPTIPLSSSVCYSLLTRSGLDPVKVFPSIRVWGTVGFIIAMFTVDLSGWKISSNQLLLASATALTLAVYAFTLPASPPLKKKIKNWKSAFGLDALVLFRKKYMAVFFVFCVFFGVCLQITNSFSSSFILGFGNAEVYGDKYLNTFTIKHSNIFLSISQVSEALFILAIPFFMKRYGIKKVILISLCAWFLRFAFYGIGNPGSGVVWLILSLIIYGMAFDFFNISASLFVEKEAPQHIRASSQGLLMMLSGGLGSIIGNLTAGYIVDYHTANAVTDWSAIWCFFAVYVLIIGILFAVFFRYKSDRVETAGV
ncbi:MAG: nucleoside permease [Bacteroidales bacterium]|nr:nucleoside permease [Bacteroidales bacterium]